MWYIYYFRLHNLSPLCLHIQYFCFGTLPDFAGSFPECSPLPFLLSVLHGQSNLIPVGNCLCCQVGSDIWRNNLPRQEQNRNDRVAGTASSDYTTTTTTSPAPSTNTSYSDDFSRNPRQLPSEAAYQRALAELMAARRGQELVNGVDLLQTTRTESQASGRGAAAFHHGGSEMIQPSGRGQHPTTGSDHLLTAPRVSLSPVEIVRCHVTLTMVFVFL